MAGLSARKIKEIFLPRGLLGRSLMIVALPILFLQVIVAFVFFDRHWDSMTDRLAFALAGEIRLISQQLKTPMTDDGLIAFVSEVYQSTDIQLTIERNSKSFAAVNQPPYDRLTWFKAGKKLDDTLKKKLDDPFKILPYEHEKWFEIIVRLDDQRVARFLCPERRLVSATTYIFILWLVASAAILFAIAMIFMRNQVRPIMRLAVAAEKLGKGQDVPDFKPAGAAEVRQAAMAFMQMKDRLKRQIEQRTTMLAGVSHDLRTPLTRMKLQLALMPAGDDRNSLHQDVIEMEKMVDGYLSFAKGEGDEAAQSVNIYSMLERIVMNARRQGTEIDWPPAQNELYMRVRPIALERACANVVMNAVKYAKKIWVQTEAQDKYFVITVDDNGPGIPEPLRDIVFKPFYRVEKSRNPKTGGTGLGLSIAQDIIHAHGGDIILSDSPYKGLRVTIRLPV